MDRDIREKIELGLDLGCVRRLLPRQPVYLLSAGAGSGRFVRLFREAWTRLPLRARRRILGHWKRGDHSPQFGATIAILGGETGRVEGEGACCARAAVAAEGHRLGFREDIVAAYPDHLVMDLIAFGMAHVHAYAIGQIRRDLVALLDDEEESRARVEEWGFSSTAIADWDLEHGVGVADPARMDEGARAGWQKQEADLYARRGR